MKKIFIIIAVVLCVWLAAAYFLTHVYSTHGNRIIPVKIKGETFQLETVSTSEKLQKGLGERKNLCESCGMLFEFRDLQKRSFWMKGMEISLDIIWIANGKVVHIEKNVAPDFEGIMAPSQDADVVLEINAGKADKLGLVEGDVIEKK